MDLNAIGLGTRLGRGADALSPSQAAKEAHNAFVQANAARITELRSALGVTARFPVYS